MLLLVCCGAGCTAKQRAERAKSRAEKDFQAGAYESAKIEYLNALRHEPHYARGYEQIGLIWLKEGAPLRAIPFLLKARELDHNDFTTRNNLALAFMAIGSDSEARKEAVSILQQAPSNEEALLVLSDTSRTKKDLLQLDAALEKVSNKDSVAFHLASAAKLMRAGNPSAAEAALKQAVASDPNSSRAHLALGYLYLIQRHNEQAENELKTSSDLASARSDEKIKYGEFLVAMGKADEARRYLEKLAHMVPDQLPTWRLLAQIALQQKRFDEALSLLENVFARDGNNPDARLLQSQIYVAKGEPAKAVGTLEHLDKTYPGVPQIKFALAGADLAGNSVKQAAAQLEQALTINPNYLEAALLLAEINLRSNKPRLVVDRLEPLLKGRPDLVVARNLLANAYGNLGQLDDVAKLYGEEVKLAPESSAGYLKLGAVLRQQKKSKEARDAFEKAAELAPTQADPVNQLVEMDLSDKSYDRAMQRVQQYLSKGASAPGRLMEAKVFVAQKELDKAQKALIDAIALDGNFSPAYDALIALDLQTHQLPEALAILGRVVQKDPGNRSARAMMAIVQEQLGDYAKARDEYEAILKLAPDWVPGLNNLAYLYLEKLNDSDRALALVQKARQLAPNDPAVADTFGWTLYQRKNYAEALQVLSEAVKNLPDNPEVQYHLGMAAQAMGQNEQAAAAFERALSAPQDFFHKEDAKRSIVSLRNAKPGGTSLATQVGGSTPQSPTDVVTLRQRGDKLQAEGKWSDAATTFEQCLAINPGLPDVTLKLAQIYYGPLHEHNKALMYAKKARELSPSDAAATAMLGRIALDDGNDQWALSLLQESSRQSNDPELFFDLSIATYLTGQVPEAQQIMERFIISAPKSVRVEKGKRFLHLTALNAKNVIQAAPEIEAAIQKEPDFVPARMALAAVQVQRNEKTEALETYSDILARHPDFAPAQKQLAILYSRTSGETAQAYDLAIKARKVITHDPELNTLLGELAFGRKEYPYVVQLLKESASQQELDASGLYYLGIAEMQTRQEELGRETLQKALNAGLPGPLADDARRHLAVVRKD